MKNIAGTWLPANDTHFTEILKKGEGYHKERILKALGPVRHFGFALDIGAHVGLMSLILADHFLRVDAFEPHPETFDCLLRNTKERMGAIKTFRMAISDRDRQVVTIRNDELKKRAGNTGARHVMPIAEHDGHVLDHLCKAGTVSVDGLNLQRPINFIKIDVEGYELRVLEGAAKTIKKYRPCIMMEVGKTPPERYDIPIEAPHDFLCDLGMTEWHRIGADRMYKWPNSNISS